MNNGSRILILEDRPADAELTERELRKAGLAFDSRRVETLESFVSALTEFKPDIILSDYGLPQFNGLQALRLLHERNLDTPFILITGSLTEEVAVECMKEGATDYILKSSLKRLPSAVTNALEKAEARRATEEAVGALRRSEEQYRLIAENTLDLISVLDLEGNYVYASPSHKAVLGYEPKELVGASAFSNIHPDDLQQVTREFREALTHREERVLELRVRHRDGEWLCFETSGNWVLDQAGNPVRCVVVSRDITERKRGEEALQRAHDELERRVEQRTAELVAANEALKEEIAERQRAEEALRLRERELADFIENGTIGLHWVDGDGIITWANRTELELLGYERDEYIGHHIADFHADGDVIEDILRRLANKEELHDYEARLRCKDGTIKHVHINSNVWWEGGKFVHTRCFTRDISGRKRAEEELQRAHEELERRVEQRTAELAVANEQLKEEIAERQHANEALRESEERFHSAFEDAAIGMALVGLDGRWLQVNKALCEIVGYSEKEMLATDFQSITHADDLERDLRHICRMLAGETQTYQMEKRYFHKQGHVVWVLLSVSLVHGSKGIPLYFISQVQDITERKRAEDALRESEKKYRSVVENVKEVIFQTDAEGAWTFLNPAWTEITGFTLEESVGRNFLEFVHPEDRRKNVEEFRPLIERRKNYCRHQIRYLTKGGEFRWIEVFARLTLDGDGAVVGTSGTLNDITERKRAELERDAERLLLDALFDQLPVGVLVRDNDAHYTQANRMAAHITGVERERLIGMRAEEMVTLTQWSHTDKRLVTGAEMPSAIALRTQKPIEPQNYLIVRPGGGERRLIASASPVALPGQGPFGSVVVLNDVTEQHAVQEQLRQSQKMESIGVLAGGIAHDFNNLLTAITGNTQLALRKVLPDDPAQVLLVEVERAAQRAAVLTRQLLAFSRRQRLERRTLNLNETINEVMKLVQRIIGEDLEVQVAEGADLSHVFADPTQVEQVVMNLAVNARDAMPQGGTLTIGTANVELDEAYCRSHTYVQPGRYVELRMSDTGVGMDEETQARIFEPFFTTKEVGKGTGLGLSMVYGIVKQHGGHIDVHSEPGRGTTFKIYLPVVEETARNEDAPAQLPLLGGTETILVAEDEEALRGLARAVLEGLGYKVLLARNGEEAVATYEAERERVDLLLFDVVMPRMGGYEAYSRIRAMGNGVPIIFMTGYSTETVQSKFVKQNKFFEEADTVLIQKPYNVEGLGRKVREVLDEAGRKTKGRT